MTPIVNAAGLPADVVRRVLVAAVRAPSLHNTQPWRFRLTDTTIELYADPGRSLPGTDPEEIELRVACGAALFNLRTELAASGVRPVVARLPDGGMPRLMATVRNGGSRPVTPEDVRLALAIPQRRTNRRPFTAEAVSSAQQHELLRAAHHEGAVLHVVRDPVRLAELGALAARAHRLQLADPGVRAELAEWTAHVGERTDGVPAAASGPPPGPRDVWTLRDFGGPHRPNPTLHAGYEGDPLIAAITSHAAGPLGDLRAGEALQRVLLTATAQGLAVSLVSQLVELPEIREATRVAIRALRPPQAVLRIGYGWPVTGSPRRPVEDLLLADPLLAAPDGDERDPHERSRLW